MWFAPDRRLATPLPQYLGCPASCRAFFYGVTAAFSISTAPCRAFWRLLQVLSYSGRRNSSCYRVGNTENFGLSRN